MSVAAGGHDGAVAERETLLWQLGVAKGLLDLVTAGLTDEESLATPAGSGSWSVREQPGGMWLADWSEEEPDPSPPTTVAWLLWHITWWWSDVSGRAFGEGPVDRDRAVWPGSVDAALDVIEGCHDAWRRAVEAAPAEDLSSVTLADRCWPLRGHPFIRVVAWVNGELMKNAAEIGVVRRILAGR